MVAEMLQVRRSTQRSVTPLNVHASIAERRTTPPTPLVSPTATFSTQRKKNCSYRYLYRPNEVTDHLHFDRRDRRFTIVLEFHMVRPDAICLFEDGELSCPVPAAPPPLYPTHKYVQDGTYLAWALPTITPESANH